MRKVLVGLSVILASAILVTVTHSAGEAGAAFVPAADAKWAPVPEMAGIQLAPLEGDPTKGSAHFLVKFTPGFAAGLHHHTADHFVTVVAGTVVLVVDGTEHKLPAGSFFSFSGMKPHETKCEAGAECVLSVDVRGAWDVVPEAGK